MRLVWASFALFYVLRWVLTISGAVALSRKSKSLKYGLPIEAFPTGDFKYSPSGKLCFAEQSNNMLLGVFLWAVPLAFDILLVVLTGSKAYQNAVLLKESSRSPIVGQCRSMVSKCTESYSPLRPSSTH